MAEDGEHLKLYLQTSQDAYNTLIAKALNNQNQKYYAGAIEEIKRLAAPLFDAGKQFNLNDIWPQMNEKLNTNYSGIVQELDNYLQKAISETADPPAYGTYPNSYLGGGRRRRTKRSKARRKTKRRSAKRA